MESSRKGFLKEGSLLPSMSSIADKAPNLDEQFYAEHLKLLTAWQKTDKKKESVYAWLLEYLMENFTKSNTYPLTEAEKELLVGDMTATNNLVQALEKFVASGDGFGHFSKEAEAALQVAHEEVCDRAEKSISSKRPALTIAGSALGVASCAAAVIVILAVSGPFMPLIAGACLLAGVIFLASAAVNQYRLNNCSFYGQNQTNHLQMLKLAEFAEKATEGKKPGCFG